MKLMSPSQKEIDNENKKIRQLLKVVDLTASVLSQGNISVPEALAVAARTKRIVLTMFPDEEATYDLIYKPRFERIIKERLETN